MFRISAQVLIAAFLTAGSGTYLANPRDTNGTPSILVGLGLGGNPDFAREGLLVSRTPTAAGRGMRPFRITFC